MKVFLSWSGEKSRHVATALRDWLPAVLQAIEPWLSSDDIPKGSRWFSEIGSSLESTDVGIICLTKENLNSNWILYEAGALSKRAGLTLVFTYAVDVHPSDLSGPLAQFQFSSADKNDTFRLLRTLNNASNGPKLPDDLLKKVFEIHWPLLEKTIEDIKGVRLADQTPQRSIEEKVDEILSLVRLLPPKPSQNSPPEKLSTPVPTDHKDIPGQKPRVFIGSSTEGLNIAEAIQLGLDSAAECTIWNQSAFDLGRTIIESIVDLSREFDFAILVLTADDMLIKRGEVSAAPRDNLLFEIGLFTGVLGRARTFMVYCRDEELELPSDLLGVTATTYGKRSDGNLQAALGPVCTRIKRAMGVASCIAFIFLICQLAA